jgi:4-hydroxy-tetrahydrodipicolinate synthase
MRARMVTKHERKEWAREQVRGLFFGNTTPFTEDLSRIDEEALRANLRHCVELGANGIGWGGPLAEPDSMTLAERKRGHEILAEEAQRGGVVSYAYVATSSFPEVLELARHCNDAGCDLIMLNVPYEWAKTDQMIYDYYVAVCEAAGDVGIMLYDTPHAGYMLPLELQDRICDIPNVCCNKNSERGLEANVRTLVRLGDRVVCSAGTIPEWPALAEAGYRFMAPSSSFYLVQTLEWQPARESYELTMRGDYEAAKALVAGIQPLLDSWIKLYSPFFGRPFGREEHPAAGIKFWEDAIGMRGGPVRPLSEPFSGEDQAWVLRALGEHAASGLLRLSLASPVSA